MYKKASLVYHQPDGPLNITLSLSNDMDRVIGALINRMSLLYTKYGAEDITQDTAKVIYVTSKYTCI
jgi:hypothetical protein